MCGGCFCGTRDCRAFISDGLRQPASVQEVVFANSSGLIGRWVLLTAVVDRDIKEFRAYLVGVLISTSDISKLGRVSSNYNLHFGSNNTPTYFFWGLIDDVSIWSKALSENEIKEIFKRLRPKFY